MSSDGNADRGPGQPCERARAELTCGDLRYCWVEPWASYPPDALSDTGWAHHSLIVTADGRLIGYESGGDAVCIFDADGALIERWSTGLVEGHGMTLAGHAGNELLWITDTGGAIVPDWMPGRSPVPAEDVNLQQTCPGYAWHMPGGLRHHGRVVAFDLKGAMVQELDPPPAVGSQISSPRQSIGAYAPTGVAVDDEAHGDGSIWVADGYGQSLVHRFSATGRHELTLTGEEGAGRFECPHAVLIDRRREEPRIYIADRTNARIQIYTREGEFITAVRCGLLSPTGLATCGEKLIVADLRARLTILDKDDHLIGQLGWDTDAAHRPGWPNELTESRLARPTHLRPGLFNSPHGLAVDSAGNIYVAEWLIGGRLVRLEPIAET